MPKRRASWTYTLPNQFLRLNNQTTQLEEHPWQQAKMAQLSQLAADLAEAYVAGQLGVGTSGMGATPMNTTGFGDVPETVARAVKGTDGAIGPITQQYYKKSYKGSKRKKTKLQKMMRIDQAMENYFVSRWQGLTLYSALENAYKLNNSFTTVSTATTETKDFSMPMFCYNLTALPINRVNSTISGTSAPGNPIATFPFYRLLKKQIKDISSGAVSVQYVWVEQRQINGGPQGTGISNAANIEWDNLNGSPPINTQVWWVEWCKIKMILKGATTRSCKLHCALASFKHTGVGPVRKYFDTAVKSWDEDPLIDEKSDGCAFWDNFWATRLSNPIRTTLNPGKKRAYNTDSKPVSIWAHESIMITNDVTINNDTRGIQQIFDKFIRLDKLMKQTNPERWGLYSQYIIGDNNTGSAYGFPAIQSTQTVPALDNAGAPYGPYDNDVFLIVWGDVYDQTTDGYKATLHPSFDLNIRCKYVYND